MERNNRVARQSSELIDKSEVSSKGLGAVESLACRAVSVNDRGRFPLACHAGSGSACD